MFIPGFHESIPEQSRPPLDITCAGETVPFTVLGGEGDVVGSTIMPIILVAAKTGRSFCIKLYALVVEDLLMMFIGEQVSILSSLENLPEEGTEF